MTMRTRLAAACLTAVVSVGLLAGCAGKAQQGGAGAKAFAPSKPVEFVVPYAPGGGSDIMARFIQGVIDESKLVSQPMNVINKAGGSGATGMAYVAGKNADEHTLMTTVDSVVMLSIQGQSPHSYKDFTPIALFALDGDMLVVKADSKYKSIKELIDDAKAKSGQIKVGGTGAGQEDAVFLGLAEKGTGVKFNYIPFKSGGEVMTNLLGGHIDVAVANPNEIISQVEAKQARALAVADAKRMTSPVFKDVPTFKESGYNVEFAMFRAVMGPAGMSKEAVAYWEGVFKKVSENPKWQKEYIEKNALTPSFKGSADFKKFLDEKAQQYGVTLKELGFAK